jgi:putative holliday junction resolvase
LTRVLALDYGSARCGCAVSDPTGTLATPLPEIPNPDTPEGMDHVVRLIEEFGAGTVLVGLPVSLSGEEGPQAQAVRGFVARLEARVSVPVRTWDERFTTKLAQTTPGRTSEDSRAAAHLLHGYLEAQP